MGTIVAAAVALLPYLNDFFITAYLAGAFAAVWFAIKVRRMRINFNEGAQLGFLSGFYGLLAAICAGAFGAPAGQSFGPTPSLARLQLRH